MGNKQKNKEVGQLGEQIASKYLKNKGFIVLEQNYWKKWGEIDIVASKVDDVTRETNTFSLRNALPESMVHFIEVKTLSYESKAALEAAVTHETWRPEEQVHQFKLHQIEKALETWILEHSYTGNWQIDVISVRLVSEEKFAKVEFIENISN
ncbi:YraN family protein [Candidatus Nomurabacteria bacterium]|nr:YraN family protein [Candidatus Nomurabacteria bacterium]